MTRPSLSMAIAAAAAVLSAAPAESTRVRRGNLRRARGAAFEASAPPDGREDSEEYLARLIELAIGGGGRRRDAAVLRAGDGGGTVVVRRPRLPPRHELPERVHERRRLRPPVARHAERLPRHRGG
ncbi:hypothetical protein THAOC_29034, partial [Thalassiosira oceanica]